MTTGEYLNAFRDSVSKFLNESLGKISADTLGWLAVLLLNGSTIPSLLALLSGVTDKTPGVDIVLLLWGGLLLLFGRAIVLKDTLNIVTIGFGFAAQAVLMALILFR